MTCKLSFCIPTHNRAVYLKETLNSIISQATEDIQIVISDNASTDHTKEVVDDASKKFSNIIYYCWDSNQGADVNYLKAVDLASGEYCWFLGSDDIIEKGAVKKILKEILSRHDIYLCSEYLCDLNMRPYKIHYLLDEKTESRVFDFSDDDELLEYFTLAQSQSALFGYLSSIIFNKQKWIKVKYDESYTGTLYSHMFMLYSFIKLGCILKYIKEPLVYWRSGNDSFGGAGKIQSRYMVDILGFNKIENDFFKDKKEISTAFRKVFRRHHPFKNIAYLRLNTSEKSDWVIISKKLVGYYDYNPLLLCVLKYDFVKPVLYLLFKSNRVLREILRSLSFFSNVK